MKVRRKDHDTINENNMTEQSWIGFFILQTYERKYPS